MNTLRAGALLLEPLCSSHAPEMFAVLADPAIYEFENEPPQSVSTLQNWYTRLETRVSPAGDEQWLNWVIRVPGGELAGFLQATVLGGGQAYVAYVLASRFWRRGIASSCLQAVLLHLAASYSVTEALAVLKADNYRSVGLLVKLGFRAIEPATPPPWPAEDGEVTMQLSLVRKASTA